VKVTDLFFVSGAVMPATSLAAAPYGMSPQQNYYPPTQGLCH
jgi:hypothetical protein